MNGYVLTALLIAAWLTTLVLGWLLGVLTVMRAQIRSVKQPDRIWKPNGRSPAGWHSLSPEDAQRHWQDQHPEHDPGLKP